MAQGNLEYPVDQVVLYLPSFLLLPSLLGVQIDQDLQGFQLHLGAQAVQLFLEVLFLPSYQVVLPYQAIQGFLCHPCFLKGLEFLSFQVNQQDQEDPCDQVHLSLQAYQEVHLIQVLHQVLLIQVVLGVQEIHVLLDSLLIPAYPHYPSFLVVPAVPYLHPFLAYRLFLMVQAYPGIL